MTQFGDRIKELREKRNWTQQDVATFVNKKRADIGGYETNRTSPNLETIVNLADLFKVSVDYLLGRTDDPYQMYNAEEMSPELRATMYRITELLKPGMPESDLASALNFLQFLSDRNAKETKN